MVIWDASVSILIFSRANVFFQLYGKAEIMNDDCNYLWDEINFESFLVVTDSIIKSDWIALHD